VREAPEPEVPEPVYIPHDVPPRLVNLDQVLSALRDGYPQGLPEEAGESVVILWLFVDVAGQVTHIRLRGSSGYDPLDRLAQDVAPTMAYRPALHLNAPIGVWVQQQIRFEPPTSGAGPGDQPPGVTGAGSGA
jgi:TonB family protein